MRTALLIALGLVDVAALAMLMFFGIARPFATWLDGKSHPSSLRQNEAVAMKLAMLWMGLPTFVLLAAAMVYHLAFSFTLATYVVIGLVAQLVYVPLRRVAGLWVTRKAYILEEPAQFSFFHNVCEYVREIFRPSLPYKSVHPMWQQWPLMLVWYVLLWPVGVALGTAAHVLRCQDPNEYVWPHWRFYKIPPAETQPA